MALLSRVAENLFWLGRYVERAENTARLLDVMYHGSLEPTADGLPGARNTWEALIQTLGLEADFVERHGEATEDAVVEYLTVDRLNGSSIVTALGAARENARSVRDYLSSETWVSINRLYHAASQRNIALIRSDGLYDFCEIVRQGAHLFAGTADGTSLHDEGWQWLQCGLHLERCDMVTRIVDSKYHLLMDSEEEVGGPYDWYQWAALLRSVSGYEAYRRTTPGGVDAVSVISFLHLDGRFQRSFRGSLENMARALSLATEGAAPRLRNPSMRLVTGLTNRLQFETAESIVAAGLHEYMYDVQITLAELSRAVSEAFFWSSLSAA
jgi:uncharacterized alpha-E superfamily protein